MIGFALPTYACEHCGRLFTRSKKRSDPRRNKFCSRTCSRAHGGWRPAPFYTPPGDKAARIRAAGLVNMRIRAGTMTRPVACQQCGRKGRTDAHHPEYANKADVKFLCRRHHMRLHRDLGMVREIVFILGTLPLLALLSPSPLSPTEAANG
jgi:hypothetical protein